MLGVYCPGHLHEAPMARRGCALIDQADSKENIAETSGLSLFQCLLVQAIGTLWRDCLNAKPSPAKPSNIIAQVEGSGTLVPIRSDEGTAERA